MAEDSIEYNDLISVIIPTFNDKRFLPECLQSLHNQTYKNLQIILVDDGSTDKTSSICDNWAKNDQRIQVIHKDRGGVSAARNAGLHVAKGTYISFVDADDYLDSHFYEKMLKADKENNGDVVICFERLIDKKGNTRISIWHEMSRIGNNVAFIKEFLAQANPASAVIWNKLYRAEFIKGITFTRGNFLESMLFNVEVGCRKGTFVWIKDRLYYHRVDDNSDLNPMGKKRIVSTVRTMARSVEIYESHKPGYELMCQIKTKALWKLEQSYSYCLNNGWIEEGRKVKDIYMRNYDNWKGNIVGTANRMKLWFIRLMPTIFFLKKKQNFD